MLVYEREGEKEREKGEREKETTMAHQEAFHGVVVPLIPGEMCVSCVYVCACASTREEGEGGRAQGGDIFLKACLQLQSMMVESLEPCRGRAQCAGAL